MDLLSLALICFLLFSALLYYTVFKNNQWICLLIISISFYLWTGYQNIAFIITTAFTTWLGGLLLSRITNKFDARKKDTDLTAENKKKLKKQFTRYKKYVLFAVLLINLGILSYLKYWEFLYTTISTLIFNRGTAALGIVLPLGISFYTFQSLGYLIDIYGKKYSAENSFFRYFVFISFFPQLIQGPINRYDQMSAQLFTNHKLRYQNIREFCYLFLFGAMKKYAIANVLSEYISLILDTPTPGSSGALIVFGILLYSIQQYADFSGGIDMVMGVAHLFDIKMMPNFRQPYFATSLGDFWRRWHISLGAWMRDYVFYPFALTKPMKNFGKWSKKIFGESIGRTLPACIANILVFFLVGLWHGPELHYILWGLYNGIIIAASDLLAPAFSYITNKFRINTGSSVFYLFRILRTFLIVNIGWYFDRIYTFNDILLCLKNTFFNFDISGLMLYLNNNISFIETIILFSAVTIVFINSIIKEKKPAFTIADSNIIIRGIFYYSTALLVLVSLATTGSASGGFMYANF